MTLMEQLGYTYIVDWEGESVESTRQMNPTPYVMRWVDQVIRPLLHYFHMPCVSASIERDYLQTDS